MSIDPDRLLACPFCGGEAELVRRGNIRYSTIVECTACGCKLESPETFDHGSAWNTRAARTEPAGAVEALREALAGLKYIEPAIPVLRTMFMTADLKLGARKAEEMDASNKQAIAKLEAVLNALSATPVPEGWRMVPVELTNKMILRCQTRQAAAGYAPQPAEWLIDIYRAMLDAAPAAPKSEVG
jgi:hypothetical protein